MESTDSRHRRQHGLNIRCSVVDLILARFHLVLILSGDGTVLSFSQAKRKTNHLILNHLIQTQPTIELARLFTFRPKWYESKQRFEGSACAKSLGPDCLKVKVLAHR